VTAAVCPACRRPIAVARPTCLYCGAALPADAAAAVARTDAEDVRGLSLSGLAKGFGLVVDPGPAPATDRLLLVVDLSGLSPDAIAKALHLPPFEAGLRARQGGLHLHLAAPRSEVEAEGARLEAAGLRVVRIPESEARTPPVVAVAGERSGARLRLRSGGRSFDVRGEDVMLVVEGPIQREYQSRQIERKKVATATLEASHRFHLHLRSESRPVELDPANFAFGPRGTVAGSSLLEMKAWIAELASHAPVDDGFRRFPPALSPATPEEGAAASLRQLGSGSARKDAPAILDNVAQFRFYSGWRGAAERRRRELTGR
jgi:hypothetical protein